MSRWRGIACLSLLLITVSAWGQKRENRPTQWIEGTIVDNITSSPIEDVEIAVKGMQEESVKSDSIGHFKISVPIGRQHIILSHISYKSTIETLLLNTAQPKQVVWSLDLRPENLIDEVVVKSSVPKSEAQNKMAYASGRMFSVEEANRYAGTLGDPARMAQSYAGVNAAQDERNDLIIRGNSPIGVQWKVDGYEIPNPNHYGGIGLTGNRVTLLNMNLMTNSDFLTAAFPAEYSNALAGVFDLSFENRQPKNQFWGQVGWNGFEAGAKGPISKNGSYMVCYRYSFLDVMKKLGMNTKIDPKYQDFTSKLVIPLGEKIDLSLLTLVGNSSFTRDDHNNLSAIATKGQYLNTSADMLFQGASIKYQWNNQNHITWRASYLDNGVKTTSEWFNKESDHRTPEWDENSTQKRYATALDYQFNNYQNHLLRMGVKWDSYDAHLKQSGHDASLQFRPLTNHKDWLHLFRIYIQDAIKITPTLQATLGLNYQYLLYNNSYSIEPRAALKLQTGTRSYVSLAYGRHAQIQPFTTYFTESLDQSLPNKNLDLSKADHFVLSYNQNLSTYLNLKVEAYYQHLFNTPVENNPNSIFSLINTGAADYIPAKDNLVNEGLGRNYGVEMTLEKYMQNNYYYMITGTLFRSQYQTLEQKWRSSAFDAKYMLNLLGGYELWTTSTFAIGADLKVTFAGGRPYIPIDEKVSKETNTIILDGTHAYEQRYNNYFRTDLKLYYRQNLSKVYLEFAVDLQNITNHKNIDYQRYDIAAGRYINYYQTMFFPMYTFKVLF
ncbi:TonB-dependent receptor [Halosquirtibacter xylanolyticus]|uniref:carboxypeptidase-like regulatory domain-containing protein n=1 Tax=Halosquirtibacter xylanolyticus TaxID=3374599 RepID=UPI003749BB88|nr:TonB-dependent receptor [Prolixibacteraceae bacterium]